jgi:hypothetical protein
LGPRPNDQRQPGQEKRERRLPGWPADAPPGRFSRSC